MTIKVTTFLNAPDTSLVNSDIVNLEQLIVNQFDVEFKETGRPFRFFKMAKMTCFRVRVVYAQPNHSLQAPNNGVLTSTHANVTVKVTVNLFRDCNLMMLVRGNSSYIN